MTLVYHTFRSITTKICNNNVTNNQIKWTVGESNDFLVIGRVKSEDTSFCDVIALQPGEEFITISSKALTKDYDTLVTKIHFVVTEAAQPEEGE